LTLQSMVPLSKANANAKENKEGREKISKETAISDEQAGSP